MPSRTPLTLPAEVAPISYQSKSVVYDLLFRAAAETLLTIGLETARRLGVGTIISFTLDIHSPMLVDKEGRRSMLGCNRSAPGGPARLKSCRWHAA